MLCTVYVEICLRTNEREVFYLNRFLNHVLNTVEFTSSQSPAALPTFFALWESSVDTIFVPVTLGSEQIVQGLKLEMTGSCHLTSCLHYARVVRKELSELFLLSASFIVTDYKAVFRWTARGFCSNLCWVKALFVFSLCGFMRSSCDCSNN